MWNIQSLVGLGLTITRPDGQTMLLDDLVKQNFDSFVYYWIRCTEKPQILKEPDTHGRII